MQLGRVLFFVVVCALATRAQQLKTFGIGLSSQQLYPTEVVRTIVQRSVGSFLER